MAYARLLSEQRADARLPHVVIGKTRCTFLHDLQTSLAKFPLPMKWSTPMSKPISL